MIQALFALLGVLILVTQVTAASWTSNNFCYKPSLGARGAEEKAKFDSGLDRVDTRLGNEKWLNDPAYGGNLRTAVGALVNTPTVLSIPPGTWAISADLNVPANITLKLAHGAVFSIGNAATLTINGNIEAGHYQIFSSIGTGKVVFGPGVSRVIPHWWGAKGDANYDDTAALQAALTTGNDVFVPAVSDPSTQYYKLTTGLTAARAGQIIEGEGDGSVLKQVTAGQVVLRANGLAGIKIKNLHGQGVAPIFYLNGCAKSEVLKCKISNHDETGIFLYNSPDSRVDGNLIIDATATTNDSSADILVLGNGSGNLIQNNRCLGGQYAHTGIVAQTYNSGDKCDNIIITGNRVGQHTRYGIVVYKTNTGADTVDGPIISNNNIRDIQGDDLYSDYKPFGSGIYVQGAEFATVMGNYLYNCNVNTNNNQNGPGAISTANVTNVTIKGNSIQNSHRYGIWVTDTGRHGLGYGSGTSFEPSGFAIIKGNNIYNSVYDGIYVLDRHNVNIEGNAIHTTTGSLKSGIAVTIGVYPDCRRININGNQTKGTTGSGIWGSYLFKSIISKNICTENAANGLISLDNSDIVTLSDNICADATGTGRGINVASTCTNILATGNQAYNNANGGMSFAAPCYLANNRAWGNAVYDIYDVNAVGIRTLTVNSATPSVKDAALVKTANTVATTITAFPDGAAGQRLTVLIADANTKIDFTGTTLKGNGGADWGPGISGNVMTGTFDGTNWYFEVGK